MRSGSNNLFIVKRRRRRRRSGSNYLLLGGGGGGEGGRGEAVVVVFQIVLVNTTIRSVGLYAHVHSVQLNIRDIAPLFPYILHCVNKYS